MKHRDTARHCERPFGRAALELNVAPGGGKSHGNDFGNDSCNRSVIDDPLSYETDAQDDDAEASITYAARAVELWTARFPRSPSL